MGKSVSLVVSLQGGQWQVIALLGACPAQHLVPIATLPPTPSGLPRGVTVPCYHQPWVTAFFLVVSLFPAYKYEIAHLLNFLHISQFEGAIFFLPRL